MANPFHGKVRSLARSAFLAAIGTAIRDQPLARLMLAEIFPASSPMALDLLQKMLTFDQGKRITVNVSCTCGNIGCCSGGGCKQRSLLPALFGV